MFTRHREHAMAAIACVLLMLAAGATYAHGAARPDAVAFIKRHEGLVLKPYPDAGGVKSICWGHTGPFADHGHALSELECEVILRSDIATAREDLDELIGIEWRRLPAGQRVALTSWVFNVGRKQAADSTLIRKHKTGDCSGAAAEFDRWVYAAGERLPGLITRRARERALYERGCP